jgi:taurine--2-oxoglutarate transaminase
MISEESSPVDEKDIILKNNLDHTLFSWSKQKGINPLNIDRAKGVYLYDQDGNKIIDFSSGLMNVNIGHGDQRVTNAVNKQMEKVSYVTPSAITKVRGELGKKLAEISPGNLNKSFFTVCGASGIENAIKLARLYTGRHKILTRYRSYHGSTTGAMSAGGDPRRLRVDVQQAPNFVHLEIPYEYRSNGSNWRQDCFDQLDRILAYEGPENFAAIIMEGESGTSGCLKLPKGYFKKLRQVCDKHQILLISDEVMSGFGRTGQWFGINNHDVIPDMMVLAKGITSGYLPFGALQVSDVIAKHFDNDPMMLGLTYSAHPTACAAALEVINIYEKDNLLNNAKEMGNYMEEQIEILKREHPSIGDFRNTGLLGCLELVKNKKSKEPMVRFNAKPEDLKVMDKVKAKISKLGMHTFSKWSYIFIAPPLCINKNEIDEGLAIISKALKIADRTCE